MIDVQMYYYFQLRTCCCADDSLAYSLKVYLRWNTFFHRFFVRSLFIKDWMIFFIFSSIRLLFDFLILLHIFSCCVISCLSCNMFVEKIFFEASFITPQASTIIFFNSLRFSKKNINNIIYFYKKFYNMNCNL